MDLIEQLGSLALASRLKRISELFFQDAVKMYNDLDVDFEPRWFPVYAALTRVDEAAITDIADMIGVSHPAVNQIAGELIKKGLVSARKCKNDRRRRLLTLTAKGREIQPVLEAFWDDVHHAAQELVCSTGYDVIDVLAKLEQGLRDKDFYARVKEHTKISQRDCVEIVRYEKNLRADFERLNTEWLKEFDMFEEADTKQFALVDELIMEPGGEIFFARCEDDIVGTCALIKIDDTTYELGKMAVTGSMRGKQIGKKLMLAAMACARDEKGATTLILESNRKLTPALNLYRSVGFTVVPLDPDSKYQRADIGMQCDLVALEQAENNSLQKEPALV